MQIKEVCEKTGLSRRTIRYYEEEGLIAPETEKRNGRTFRNYSESDVQRLQMIASLRKAWFSIEEIKTMQQEPEQIAEILPRYLNWLEAQQETLQGLIAAARQLKTDEISSVEMLTEKLSQETEKLPLPKVDVQPHFRYLDELEEAPAAVSAQKRDKTTDKIKLILGLGAAAVVVLILIGVNYLMNRPKVENNVELHMSGSGYVGVAERDRQLFCVDTSGVIYEMDWDTGHKTSCGKIPAEERWITDEAFRNAYYMQGTTLMRYDIVTKELTELCELPDCLEPKAATDQVLIYISATENANALAALDLNTLQVTSTQDGEWDQSLLIDSDVAYYILFHDGPLEEDKYMDIVAWDLQTGDAAVLAHYDNAKKTANQVIWRSLAVVGDRVYYCCRGDDEFLTLYCVPKDGSAAPEPVKPEGFEQITWSGRCMGSGYLCACTGDTAVVYGLDEATGQLTPFFTFDSWIDRLYMVENGRRYAAYFSTDRENVIVLGDLMK